MFIGFIAAKSKVLTKEALSSLSNLIVKVILPALIFGVIAGSGITIEEFLISGRFLLGVIVCYTFMVLTGIVISKFCNLEGKASNIFIALATFGNMGFMGIPLIQAVFTDPVANVCISVYSLVDMVLLWTFGTYLCSRHQQDSHKLSAVKNIINPMTIALIIAFIIMFLKIPVPDLAMNTIIGIGNTSRYLTMIYLGGALAYVSLGKAVKNPSTYILIAVKMLLLPILIYFLLGLFLPEVPRSILTFIVGLPAMTTIAMLANIYGSDDSFATEIIFITTIFSLLTIPAISIITSVI